MKFFSLFVILTASIAIAATPPMSQEELQKESDQIVIARIDHIKCNGKTKERSCSFSTPYEATLRIQKTLKGKEFKELKLLFSQTRFKARCVGPSDPLHFKGEVAKFFLKCSADGCGLTASNGVEYIMISAHPLPQCP